MLDQRYIYYSSNITSSVLVRVKLSDSGMQFCSINIFSVILLKVFLLFHQNVARMLVNGTNIKIYKYVYKYNRVFALYGWVDWSSSHQCKPLAFAGLIDWSLAQCQKCSITTPIQNTWQLQNTLLFYVEHLCLYGQCKTLFYFESPIQSSLYVSQLDNCKASMKDPTPTKTASRIQARFLYFNLMAILATC